MTSGIIKKGSAIKNQKEFEDYVNILKAIKHEANNLS